MIIYCNLQVQQPITINDSACTLTAVFNQDEHFRVVCWAETGWNTCLCIYLNCWFVLNPFMHRHAWVLVIHSGRYYIISHTDSSTLCMKGLNLLYHFHRKSTSYATFYVDAGCFGFTNLTEKNNSLWRRWRRKPVQPACAHCSHSNQLLGFISFCTLSI